MRQPGARSANGHPPAHTAATPAPSTIFRGGALGSQSAPGQGGSSATTKGAKGPSSASGCRRSRFVPERPAGWMRPQTDPQSRRRMAVATLAGKSSPGPAAGCPRRTIAGNSARPAESHTALACSGVCLSPRSSGRLGTRSFGHSVAERAIPAPAMPSPGAQSVKRRIPDRALGVAVQIFRVVRRPPRSNPLASAQAWSQQVNAPSTSATYRTLPSWETTTTRALGTAAARR